MITAALSLAQRRMVDAVEAELARLAPEVAAAHPDRWWGLTSWTDRDVPDQKGRVSWGEVWSGSPPRQRRSVGAEMMLNQ